MLTCSTLLITMIFSRERKYHVEIIASMLSENNGRVSNKPISLCKFYHGKEHLWVYQISMIFIPMLLHMECIDKYTRRQFRSSKRLTVHKISTTYVKYHVERIW